ncbi:hypothetical protein [Actinomadura sp. 7K507]|uniref:hypothetical protein n=1 Tax=Actinomadura sp. 7K507 TaxID=2530365 RepID=UPI001404EBE6|nr:hypothetical protein [Actinomadura sp. 7K507]
MSGASANGHSGQARADLLRHRPGRPGRHRHGLRGKRRTGHGADVGSGRRVHTHPIALDPVGDSEHVGAVLTVDSGVPSTGFAVPVRLGPVESGSVESGSVESGSVESGSVESSTVEPA